MKKIILLLSLVILVTSCASKTSEKEVNIENTGTQVETPVTDTNEQEVENIETGITSSGDEEVTVEPVKVDPKPVVKVVTTKPKPVIGTPPKTNTVVTPPKVEPVIPAPVESTVKTVTKAEVANHNIKPDCYTIIDAKVYNITSFFGKHPGGDARIIGLCGVDGTSAFNSVHARSQKAIMTKNQYYIADFAK